jgi:hypothetical protein
MRFAIEEVDLAELAQTLREKLAGMTLEDSVLGRTLLRDAVADHLGCSILEAERTVDTMIARGFLFYDEQAADGAGAWAFEIPA